jgi:peptidoglycan hydrolase CwlO-like protein
MEQHLSILISGLTLVGILIAFRDKIFYSGSNKQKLDDRVTNLEKSDCTIKESIDDINKDLKSIKENHLAHIQKDMNSINIKIERIETTLDFIKNK